MCGIYGFSAAGDWSGGGAFLARALEEQRHRGPDGKGVVADGKSGIAMVRLRVRADPTEAEPIVLPDGGHVAYNGEVYRDCAGATPGGGLGEIEALFDSGRSVDGMYATLHQGGDDPAIALRRDPYGIKPLYLHESAEGIAFASEIGPLLQVFGKLRIRRDAVAQFLALGRPIDGLGFLEGIRQLPPGDTAIAVDGRIKRTGGTDVRAMVPNAAGHKPPTTSDIRTSIRNAVEATIVSNRRVGVALSGGLDSSILAAELAALGVPDLDVISVRMEGSEDGIDDLAVQELPGSAWHSWRLSSGVFRPAEYPAQLRRAIEILGEPTQMTSAPLYLRLAEQAAQAGVTVLMLGEGADELFCGYRSYLPMLGDWSLRDFHYRPAERRAIAGLLDTGAQTRIDSALDSFLGDLPGDNDWGRLRAAELGHNLLPLLNRSDHTLMRMSIEGRTPFLHGDVASQAFRLPIDALLRDGQTKVFLREAYADLLPAHYAAERKKPFRAPIASWFASALAPWLTAELARGAGVFAALGINAAGVQRIGAQAITGDPAAARIAFCLLTLLLWVDGLVAGDMLNEPDLLNAYRPPANLPANAAICATTA